MTTRIELHKQDRQIRAHVFRKKYWLFGPWVEEVYVRKFIYWENLRTGKRLDFLSALRAALETEYDIRNWEGWQ